MGQPTANNPVGESLTQDAWRRFVRRPSSRWAFGVLLAVVLTAFFTPLLPLQPSDSDNTKLAFTAPSVWPLFEATYQLDTEKIAAGASRLPAARQQVHEANAAYRLAIQAGEPATTSAAYERLKQARATVNAYLQGAYTDAGYPKLDPLARWMVRTRYAVFGEWQLASLGGRDELGRDVLSRICWGARVSLIVGFVATLVSLVIGVTYGAVAGYIGGMVDNLMMRLVDVLYSVPFIFVVILLISFLSEEQIKAQLETLGIDRITIFYFVVGAIYWLTMARVVRGQVLSLRNEPFVEAARSLGVSHAGIIRRHIIPNLLSVVIVYLTLTIPRVILFEAFLSFLGLGVEPPDVSWGLLADQGIKVISPVKTYWWLILFPSAAIGATLFALNFLGDALRDAFDPKLSTN